MLLETIRMENGALRNLGRHRRRLNDSRRELFGVVDEIDLSVEILPPGNLGPQRYKCRVLCDTVVRSIEFQPYEPRMLRSLKLVDTALPDYRHKYADRSEIELLRARRGGCDDILIVVDGLLTDTSYSNIALYDGERWWTPERPLLAGTMRARLLEEGLIRTARLTPADLKRFEYLTLVNAMLDLGEVKVPTGAVV